MIKRAREKNQLPEVRLWKWGERGIPGVHVAQMVGFLEKQGKKFPYCPAEGLL